MEWKIEWLINWGTFFMYNKRNYLSYSYSKCFQSMIYTHKTNCSEIPVNTFFKKNCKKRNLTSQYSDVFLPYINIFWILLWTECSVLIELFISVDNLLLVPYQYNTYFLTSVLCICNRHDIQFMAFVFLHPSESRHFEWNILNVVYQT